MNTILIVDDDPEIRDTVGFLLEDVGYGVVTAANGQELYKAIESNNVDLIILDLLLGKENGLELAMKIRKTSIIPIIMLSGKKSEADRVVGLELGADDYITKPYSSAELMARVKSVLRRTKLSSEQQVDEIKNIATFQDWRCNLISRKLFNNDGNEILLSSGEFSLLVAFLKNPSKTLSREKLLNLTDRGETFDRSIDVQIMRLRRKIEVNPSDPQLIISIRSAGYFFSTGVNWV